MVPAAEGDGRQRLRAVLDVVSQPALLLDAQRRVLEANRAFQELFGLGPSETRGRPVYDLAKGAWKLPRLQVLLEEVLPHEDVVRDFTLEQDFAGIGWRRLVLNARRMDDTGAVLLTLRDDTARDVTREQAEQYWRHRSRLLGLIHEIAILANAARTVDEALRGVLQAVCAYHPWQVGHVYLRGESGSMVPSGLWHNDAETDIEPFILATMRTVFERGYGLVGKVVETGRPVWSADLAAESEWLRDASHEVGLRAAGLFPVVHEDRVAAVLEFFSRSRIPPDTEFMEAMRNVGIQLGHLMDRKQLERQVAELAAEERQRLGRELHDSLGQQIAGIGMMADSLNKALSGREAPEAARAGRLAESIADAKKQVSALARGLVPIEVGSTGLMRALDALAAGSEVMYDVPCEFRCEAPVHVEHTVGATHLYRIAQEAIHNAVEHGAPRRIVVGLRREAGEVVLEITDDGRGIPADRPSGNGMGLRIMRYRAGVIGAHLAIEPGPGGGTLVRCRLPV